MQAAGVDESLEEFEQDPKGNLYRIWNRMSSGTYFHPPRKLPIPKKSGGTRVLGVPTVSDRSAQTVVKRVLEPMLNQFLTQIRVQAGRSAHDAIIITRQRCWQYDWVVEFDIQGTLDNIDHDLLPWHHCQCRCVVVCRALVEGTSART